MLLLLTAFVVTLNGKQEQRQPGRLKVAGKGDEKNEKKEDRPPDEENIPFSFPYDRDAKSQLKAARDYLAFKEVPWNRVCPLLQHILEARSDSFFNVIYTVGNEKRITRISVKTEANRIISAFNSEGLQFYQQAYGQTASALLDEAIKANYDIPLLADLSQKYFHTKAGAEATILLGTVYLERGNYLESAYAFERMLTRPASEEFLTARTLFKACLALSRSGDIRHAELLKTTEVALGKATAKDGLPLGRKNYTFEQLKAEIDRPLTLIRVNSTVGEWSVRGGNPARSGTIRGGPPFLDPTFRTTMFYTGEDDGNKWIKDRLETLFARESKEKSIPLPAFFPITTPDMVIFRSYNGVFAVASRDQVVNGRIIRAGDIRWTSKTAWGLHQLLTTDATTDVDTKQTISGTNGWWSTYEQTGVKSILYENPLIGSLSHDEQNVYFVDDLAIPPPPTYSAPEFGINPLPQYRQAGDLAEAVRAGRLAAVNLRTGSVVWDLGRVKIQQGDTGPPLPSLLSEDEADKTTNAFQLCLDAIFLGPPLPLDGKLYVLIEQAGVIRLLCLDPKILQPVAGRAYMRVPTLVWSQKLGRPNSALPQDSIRRYQGATLAASEGIIVCPTNSGALVAVDIMSHSLLWAHAYRKVEPNDRPRQPSFNQNGQPILPMQLPVDRWRAAGPIIANGRVVSAAYDSNKLECQDLRTGRVLWSIPREAADLYIGGIVNDRVVIVGKNQIRAYHLTGEDPETLRPKVAFDAVPIAGTPTGHGIGGKNVYYLPVRPENAGIGSVPPAEIWAVNVETGQIVSKTAARKRNDNAELAKFGIGNLVFQDGIVFAQSAWELACYPQLEQKKAEMDRLLVANPKDPIGLLARGELLLDDGKLKEAIADFKEAEKANLPEEKLGLLREKKYVAFTELLLSDFAAGEKYLDEYKALCEIPVDPNDGPEEKVRFEDEMSRRQRYREFLLAKGRESQGKLGEAFNHYMALAGMGEAKNLLDMPDQPNIRMRADVWARGRIESMMRRATDPVARKSLDERVQKEWEAIKNGNDLKQLRDFVSLFGPYTAVGAEAQFLLAEKLLETNNPDDTRDAQSYLSQLRATAEAPVLRARATEALARLMIRNQLMEDAVGLYLQLGREYPNVLIRDGKTSTDFVTDLLTDKRLLSYLEPSRYPMPTRMKAEQREPVPGGGFAAQFEIEPSGDLFPLYRRYRFAIDQMTAGNGSWTVRVYDKATGSDQGRFPGLNQPQNQNSGTMPFSKFVQANGQLLLVQLGSYVYCLDLAEKKQRWDKNLLGETGPAASAVTPMQSIDADGEVISKYDDGYIITLGKAAVLQAGYAALLTRDGLEVVEPLTRRILWTRKGIPTRTQLYGDSRYLILLVMDTYKKLLSTEIIRAVDGTVVEGCPDAKPILEAAKSFQIIGHNALLIEGGSDQPRTLRLYDLVTGKDVWKKQYQPKAIAIKSQGSEWCGFINPDGVAEVIEIRTGRVAATLKIDPKNIETDLKPCVSAQLFADADRFYLILDRDPNLASTNGTRRLQVTNYTIRTNPVNGPIYAFERSTGKRLWNYGNGLLENQMMILEQFADLPVIIFAGPVMNQNNQYSYPVVVIEKARGRLLLDRSVQYNGNFFQNINVIMKNGQIEMNRFDVRILISPDESGKPGTP
jgi:outer membrane protein assembly factor BamB/TolA-binding protein